VWSFSKLLMGTTENSIPAAKTHRRAYRARWRLAAQWI